VQQLVNHFQLSARHQSEEIQYFHKERSRKKRPIFQNSTNLVFGDFCL